MLSTLAAQLFVHEGINTTEAKAKVLRPYAEKLITKAKRGDLASRREVLKDITDRDVVARLFHEIGPRFAERQGGYIRILKLGQRPGTGRPWPASSSWSAQSRSRGSPWLPTTRAWCGCSSPTTARSSADGRRSATRRSGPSRAC